MTIYEKVVSIFSEIRNAIGRKMVREDVASKYDPAKSYVAGDLVVYNNVLYMCTNDHSIAEWSNDDFEPATVDQALKYAVGQKVRQTMEDESVATQYELASDFDTTMDYPVGSLVLHEGTLYRCTTFHAQGSWGDGSDFTPSNVNRAIESSVGEMATALEAELREDLVPKGDVAVEFDQTGGPYLAGQLVYHDGTLYRCTIQHDPGPWNDGYGFSAVSVSGALALKADKSEMSITSGTSSDRKLVTLKPGNSQEFLTDHQDLADYATKEDLESFNVKLAKKPSYDDLGMAIDTPKQWFVHSGDTENPFPEGFKITFDSDSGEYYVWNSSWGYMAGGIEPSDPDEFEFEYNGYEWTAERLSSNVLLDRTINQIADGRYSDSLAWMVPPPQEGIARHFFVHLDAENSSLVSSLDIQLAEGDTRFYGVSGDMLCLDATEEMLLEFLEISPGHILVRNCLQVYEMGSDQGFLNGILQIGECQDSSY